MHLAPRPFSVLRNALLASCLLLVGIAASAFAQGPAPSCEITGPTSVLVDEPFMLCGISGTGLTYTWQDGEGNVINHDRCLDFPNGLPAPGTYDYEFTISQGPDYLKCPVQIVVREPKKPGGSCPRSPGFWKQQADQKDNGSTKFSKAQVTAIAECISDAVDVFDWGTGDAAFNAFKATINPPTPMTNERQVKRQFAALLANVCATGVVPAYNTSIEVFLDTDDEYTCKGETMTIAELIDAVDDELTSMHPDFGKYIDCLDDINNKIGIALDEDCRAEDVKGDVQQRLGSSPFPGSLPTELSFSASNPATRTSVLRFALPADGQVSMKIFDVAGRQVADLGAGFMTAGSHTMEWDVRGVARGLYFARLAVNGQMRTQQIVVSR